MKRPKVIGKIRYVGEPFFLGSGLTDGTIYDCLGVEDGGEFGLSVRVVDDEGWDAPKLDAEPYGYLYSSGNPAPLDGSSSGGRWEIVEDDADGTLRRAIYG